MGVLDHLVYLSVLLLLVLENLIHSHKKAALKGRLFFTSNHYPIITTSGQQP